MKKCFLLLLIFIYPFTASYGQKEGYNWRFGYKAGLDFTNGTPQYITSSKLLSYEGCSVISDSIGNLLFYTNGRTIWNATNDTIDKSINCCVTSDVGTGPGLGTSSTQGVLILPSPDSLYWIFTLSDSLKAPNYLPYVTTYLRYSIIDKRINNGKGGIIQKNIIAYDINTSSEKLAAVRHANGRDWWLVSQNHKNGFDYYYIFIFKPNNQEIHLYNTHKVNSSNNKIAGQIVFNPAGNKLALAKYSDNNERLIIWDFNRCTGELNNMLDLSPGLPNDFNPYGVAFSPKSTKLYVSSSSATLDVIAQFSLYAGDVQNSFYILHSYSPNEGMSYNQIALGPDDKIYFSCNKNGLFTTNILDSLNNHISVINEPEKSQGSCNVITHSIYLGQGSAQSYGLPNIPNHTLGALYDVPLSDAGPGRTYCGGDSILLGTPAVAGTLYRWRPAFGLSDAAAAQPAAAPEVTTTYTLSVINEAGDSCYFNQDMVTIYVPAFPSDFNAFTDGFTDGFNASFSTSGNENLTYLWKFGDGDSSFLKTPAHIYPDTGNYTVTLLLTDTLSGCQKTLTDNLHIGVSQINNITKVSTVKLYPNPANESLTVEHDFKNATLDLIDGAGKVVHSQNAPHPKTVIDLRPFAKGIYYVRLVTNLNQILSVKKLIIR